MSGESNVVYWLQSHGVDAGRELVQAIFTRAKESSTVLGEEDLLALCAERGVAVGRS